MEFRFAIGDIVQSRMARLDLTVANHAGPQLRVELGSQRRTYPLLIVGRLYEECPGGAQIHYRVRGLTAELVTMHELELEPYPQAEVQ